MIGLRQRISEKRAKSAGGQRSIRTRQRWLATPSRSQQRGRYDGDSIRPAVRVRPGAEDHGVEKVWADTFTEPHQVSAIPAGDRASELHLDRKDPPVRPFQDEVDLPISVTRSKVADPSFRCLGIDPQIEADEGFEQRAKERRIPWGWRACQRAAQQAVDSGAAQSCCQRRIGQMVLSGKGQPGQGPSGWRPRRKSWRTIRIGP